MPSPDFGRTAVDYRRYRAGFPDRLVDDLQRHGVGLNHQDVVDVGTGTGTLARLLEPHVASVRGVDPAEALLVEARDLDDAAGVSVEYSVGTAESTGLATGSADVVTAGQCWHWFDAGTATRELGRVLRPGGQLVIAHFDWLPLPGNVVEATERLILEANPAWTMSGQTGLYPRWLTDLRTAGYRDVRTFSFDSDVPYVPDAWVGRVRASAGIGGSLPDAEVTRFSDRLSETLQSWPGRELLVPHRTWAVLARRGPQEGAGQ